MLLEQSPLKAKERLERLRYLEAKETGFQKFFIGAGSVTNVSPENSDLL